MDEKERQNHQKYLAEQLQYHKHAADPELMYYPEAFVDWRSPYAEAGVCDGARTIGYLPVYLNKEDAQADFPAHQIKEIWLERVQ